MLPILFSVVLQGDTTTRPAELKTEHKYEV